FTGVVAPAGTSATIVAKLNAAINESLKSADIVAALGKLGAEVRTGSAQEFAAFIAKGRAMWIHAGAPAGSQAGGPRSAVAEDYQGTEVLRRDDRHQQERVLVAGGIDRVLPHIVVGVVMRVRRAADAVARLDVEADAVAFFEHHRGRPNLHLYLDDLIGLEPLPPQMFVIGPIGPR